MVNLIIDNWHYWIALLALSFIFLVPEIILFHVLNKRLQKELQKFEPASPNKKEPYIQEFLFPQGKKRNSEYEAIFLQPAKTISRNGRSVNLRNEFHEKISSITCMFQSKNVTIYGYVDNVLHHHFTTYHKEILNLAKQRGCRINIWKQ